MRDADSTSQIFSGKCTLSFSKNGQDLFQHIGTASVFENDDEPWRATVNLQTSPPIFNSLFAAKNDGDLGVRIELENGRKGNADLVIHEDFHGVIELVGLGELEN